MSEYTKRALTCFWLFPLMFGVVVNGLGELFFIIIFGLMMIEVFSVKKNSTTKIFIFEILFCCCILMSSFLSPEELAIVLVIVITNDSGALFLGKVFGGRIFLSKPVPIISPNKTYEGYIGGILVSIFNGFIVSKILGYESLEMCIIAILLSVIGDIGDLLASFFKRRQNIKDSGNSITSKIFYGHGGALDRFDSFSFVSPFAYLYFCINI